MRLNTWEEPADLRYDLTLFSDLTSLRFTEPGHGVLILGPVRVGKTHKTHLVELALVVDVLPDPSNAAKDLGVFNFAGAVPFSFASAVAPAILAVGGGRYSVLYVVAGVCALLGAVAIVPVKRVR